MIVPDSKPENRGRFRLATIEVDACIAPIVRALNCAGIYTKASCCGHGQRPGNIALMDGRELVICPDYETARQVDKALIPATSNRGFLGRLTARDLEQKFSSIGEP